MKKINRWVIIFLLVAVLLSACGGKPQSASGDELNGTIAISGAFALYPMMQRWAEEFTLAHPDVLFDVSAGGAGKGMTDALSGAVDIGMVSRAISEDEVAQGAYYVPVVIDAVFPTISADNPVLDDLLAQGITREIFTGIFITGEITTWGQVVGRPEITDAIHVYTRSDSCGAADVWAKFLDDHKQEDLLGIGISSDPGLLDAVINDPLGIGYNNLNYAFDFTTGEPVVGSVVVAIDKDGDRTASTEELLETKAEAQAAVADGTYPAPPARALNLVTRGKPEGLVQVFIEWILTDGQQYVDESGYIQLPEDILNEALTSIR